MPLIFSTYKIKLGGLGGIIPTANLFSRFLEKNVEQAVDVFGNFSQVAYAFNSYEGQRANRSYAQTFEYINSLESGFEIFYDLNFIPPKVNVGRKANRSYAQTFEYINSTDSGFEMFYDLNFIPPKVNVGENFPEVHLTFNGKVIDIEVRQIWDTVAVV